MSKDNLPTKNVALKDISLSTSVEDLIKSDGLPKGVDSKEKFLLLAQYGKELGWDPMTSVNSISLIRGKMTIASSMLGALLKNNGYEFLWLKDYEPDDNDPEKIVSEIQLFWWSKTLKREFSQKFKTSWNELVLAGLPDSNPTYNKYPKAMLRARCMAFAVRAIAPQVLAGSYTDMEIIDKGVKGFEVNVNEEGEVTVTQSEVLESKVNIDSAEETPFEEVAEEVKIIKKPLKKK